MPTIIPWDATSTSVFLGYLAGLFSDFKPLIILIGIIFVGFLVLENFIGIFKK
jgi:hypothetical protein